MKGNLTIKNLEEEEIKAISSLGFIINNNEINIPIKKLSESIGLEEPNQLKDLVEEVLGKKLIWKKKEIQEKNLGSNNLLNSYLKKSKTKLLRDYIVINPYLLKLDFFDKLFIIFNNLYTTFNETLGNFSGQLIGEPHFLDINSPHYKQVIKYLKFCENINEKITLEKEKELLLSAGLTTNPLNTFIITYGFRAINSNNKNSLILEGALKEKEDVNLNLSNILKFKKIVAQNSKVLIVENPNAYITLKKMLIEYNYPLSLICTGGELNQSAYLFIEKLEKNIETFYSGDIDPEGLLIAQRIKKRFPFINLIGFERDIYKKYKSSIEINKKSLAKLKKVELNIGIDFETISKLELNKNPAYQELFCKDLLKILFHNN